MSGLSGIASALLFMAQTAPSKPAEAPRTASIVSEPYVASGFTYFGSERRVIAGVGGGLGFRLHLGRMFAIYAEGRYVAYTGNALTGALGGSSEFQLGPLDPLVGLQGILYGGDRVEVIDSAHPIPPPAVAWALQARLAPLRFVHAPFTVTVMSGDVGFGIDAKSRAIAVTLTWLDIGVRF